MNIILRELRANLKSLIIWCICIAFLISMASTEFATFSTMDEDFSKIMDSFPDSMSAAFGFDMIRFDTAEGFYSYIGQYIMVMAAIYATLLGIKILSREIRKKTVETTFALPLTRRYIISMKLLAALIYCLIFTLFCGLTAYGVFARFDFGPFFLKRLWKLHFFMFILQLFFLTGGLFISIISKNHKQTGKIAAFVTVGLYMLSFVKRLGEKTDFLKYITPFEYFPSISIMNGTRIELYGLIILPGLILAFTAWSYLRIPKKDIYI